MISIQNLVEEQKYKYFEMFCDVFGWVKELIFDRKFYIDPKGRKKS
jgi:hypothetical protein